MKSIVLILLLACSFAYREANAQWSSDILISTDTSAGLNENMGRCLAVSGDSVHVVWMDRKTDSTVIYYKHSYDGGHTWSAQVALTPFLKSVDMPSIAASGPILHVVYRDNSGAQPQSMYLRSMDAGTSWITGGSQGSYYFWPNVVSRGSDVYVGYNDNKPGNSEVYLSHSSDAGVTWTNAYELSNASGRSEDQTIAAADGNVYVAWNDNRTGTMQSWYRYSNDNGISWSPETQLTSSTAGTYFPYLEAQDSNVEYVGGDKTPGAFEVFYKHSSDHGTSWTSANQLTFSGGKLAGYPVISRDRKDLSLVYFVFGGPLMYLHSRDNFATWDSTVLVSADKNPGQGFVAAAADAIHVIWLDKRSGHPQIYYKQLPIAAVASGFIAPKSVNLGNLRVGETRDTTIWIKNSGTEDINILQYVLSDPAHVFTVIDSSKHRIAPNDSISVTIGVHAYNLQQYGAQLEILTDERTTEDPHYISITANVVSGQLVTPTSVAFGVVPLGNRRDTTIVLRNNGTVSSHITQYSLADLSGGFTLIDTSVHDVAAKDSATIAVRFSPLTPSQFVGVLTIHTDEAGVGTHAISFTGTGDTTVSVVEGIAPSGKLLRIEVVPQPASTNSSLRLHSDANHTDVTITYYDVRGASVAVQVLGLLPEGERSVQIPLMGADGTYIVVLRSGANGIATGRILFKR